MLIKMVSSNTMDGPVIDRGYVWGGQPHRRSGRHGMLCRRRNTSARWWTFRRGMCSWLFDIHCHLGMIEHRCGLLRGGRQ